MNEVSTASVLARSENITLFLTESGNVMKSIDKMKIKG